MLVIQTHLQIHFLISPLLNIYTMGYGLNMKTNLFSKKKIVWPTHLSSICDCSVSTICCLLFLSMFFIFLDGCYLWAALLPLPIFSVLSRKWHFQIIRICQADLIHSAVRHSSAPSMQLVKTTSFHYITTHAVLFGIKALCESGKFLIKTCTR